MAQPIEFSLIATDQMSKAFGKAGTVLAATARAAATALTATTALGVAAFANTAKFASMDDAVGKMSDRLGIATEELSKLHFAAELGGVSTATMDMAMQRLTRRAAEAAQGTGEAVKAFQELGINAKVFNDLPLEDKMAAVADALNDVDNRADKVRLAFKLFDSEGVQLLQTMTQGSESFRQAGNELERLGGVVTKDAAGNAADFNDSMTKLGVATSSMGRKLAEELTPSFTALINQVSELIIKFGDSGFFGTLVRLFDFIVDKAIPKTLELASSLGLIPKTFESLELKEAENRLKNLTNTVDELRARIIRLNEASGRPGEAGIMARLQLEQAIPGLEERLDEFNRLRTRVSELREELNKPLESPLITTPDFGGGAGIGTRPFEETMLGQALGNSEEFQFNIDNAFSGATLRMETFALEQMTMREEQITQWGSFWGQLGEMTNNYFTNFKTFGQQAGFELFNTFMNVSNGIGQAVGASIVQGKNLGKSLELVLKRTGQELIAMLIRVGIQRLVLGKLSAATNTSMSAQSFGRGLMEVYLNSFASAAAIPLIGWSIAPGIASANQALAAAGGAASIATGGSIGASVGGLGGIADRGIDFIPRRSAFFLDRGERVLSPEQNRDLTSFLAGSSSNNLSVEQMVIEINVATADALLNMSDSELKEVLAEKLIPVFNELEQEGIKPNFAAR